MSDLVKTPKIEANQVRHLGTVFASAPGGNGIYVNLRDGKRAFVPWNEAHGVRPGDTVALSLLYRHRGDMSIGFDCVRAE